MRLSFLSRKSTVEKNPQGKINLIGADSDSDSDTESKSGISSGHSRTSTALPDEFKNAVAGFLDQLIPEGNSYSWGKVWAVLEDRKLKLYVDRPDHGNPATFRPIGYIDLGKATVSGTSNPDTNSHAVRYCFKIIESTFESTFSSESSDALQTWISGIEAAISGVIHKSFDHESMIITHSSKAILKNLPRKTGKLKKKAIGYKAFGIRTWKKRYFKLEEGKLRYYSAADFNPTSLKGVIDLRGCNVSRETRGSKANMSTVVVHMEGGKALEMTANTPQDAASWNDAINETIEMLHSKQKKKGRRRNIADRSDRGSTRDIHLPIAEKSRATKKLIANALSQHFLFSQIDDKEDVMDILQPKKAKPGELIIYQGEKGDMVYILEYGLCEVVKDGKTLAQIEPGRAFGELALIHDVPRAASIRVLEESMLWTLDRQSFRRVLKSIESSSFEEKCSFLKQVEIFESLDEQTIATIAEALQIAKFDKDEYLIRQGDIGDCFFILKSGEVVVTQNQSSGVVTELTRCTAGQYFGELALMNDEPRKANVVATNRVKCYTIDRVTFSRILGPLREVLDLNADITFLRSINLLYDFSTQKLTKIAKLMDREVYNDGDIIIEENSDENRFFMLQKGEVNIYQNNKQITHLITGGHFGETAILDDTPSKYKIISVGETICMILSKENFKKLLGSLMESISRQGTVSKSGSQTTNLLQMMNKAFSSSFNITSSNNEEKEEKKSQSSSSSSSSTTTTTTTSSSSSKPSSPKKKKVDPFANITMEDLNIGRVLGKGTFGCVRLCTHPTTGTVIALKQLQKEIVMRMHQEKNVFSERNILKSIDHPFILNLYGTFQDRYSLYMLLEILPGGELWTLLHGDIDIYPDGPFGGLVIETVQFYAANVLAALTYCHENNIAYRDLKPENLVMDAQGYLKIVDFGFAKTISPMQKTNTLCGTPEYLAPELVLSRGHNRGVDLWAFGVLVFELMTRRTPFYDDDQGAMFNKIARSKEYLRNAFPRRFNKTCKELILLLLHPNPAMRIGALRDGMQQIWEHDFFLPIPQSDLEAKSIIPPYDPEITDSTQTTNFEDYDEDDPVIPYHGKFDFSKF